MEYVPDSCALFNLANGNALATVVTLPRSRFLLSKGVYAESRSIASLLDELIESGRMTWLDDSAIPADEYLRLKSAHQLGDGETECLAACLDSKYICVTDDLAARRACIRELGETKVTGSIGLLRACVNAQLIDRRAAFISFEKMRMLGGFLPQMNIENMFPVVD